MPSTDSGGNQSSNPPRPHVSSPESGAPTNSTITINTKTTATHSSSDAAPSTNSDAPHAKGTAPTPSSTMKRRRGHRTLSEVWKFLTRELNPHHALRTTCMHCGSWVAHHHKSEKARAHLQGCTAFRTYLNSAEPLLAWPTWLNASNGTRKRKRKTADARLDSPSTTPPARLGRVDEADDAVASNEDISQQPAPCVGMEAPLEKHHTTTPHARGVLEMLAQFFYSSGTPLRHVEDPNLHHMLSHCLPTKALPTKNHFTGTLLGQVHSITQSRVDAALCSSAIKYICVNAWYSSVYMRDQSGMMCLIGMERETFFLETVRVVAREEFTEAEATDVLVEVMERLLLQAGPRACGIVMDNSVLHQRTWTKLKTLFPTQFFHGCASHGLHLFVNGIFLVPPTSNSKQEAGGKELQYPFLALHELSERCRQMVNFFRDTTDGDIQRVLVRLLDERQLTMPHFPPRYQWRHLKAGFESILAAKTVLGMVVPSRTFLAASLATERQIRMQLHMTAIDSDFERNLRLAIAILTPLTVVMQRLEEDSEMLCSDIFYVFAKELPEALKEVDGASPEQLVYLHHLNQQCFSAIYGDSHGIAYLLDPRYIGDGLSAEVRKNVEDMIFELPLASEGRDVNSDDQRIAISQELTEYVIAATREKHENTHRFKMLVSRKKSVLQFWLTDGLQWPLLQRAAVNVFHLPVSTLPSLFRCQENAITSAGWAEEREEVRNKLLYVHRNNRPVTETDVPDGASSITLRGGICLSAGAEV